MNKKHEEELMDELETFLEFEVDPDEKEDVELVETISTIKTKLENRGVLSEEEKEELYKWVICTPFLFDNNAFIKDFEISFNRVIEVTKEQYQHAKDNTFSNRRG
jgi:hypothetical protein